MKNFIIVLILYFIFTVKGYTEINYLDYQLGMSQQALYEQLTKDRFYFSEVSEETVKAKKYAFIFSSEDKEFDELNASVSVAGKFCNGRLFEFDIINYFKGKQNGVFVGRKQFYQYLKDNKAVPDDFKISKKEGTNLVSHSYIIDRNNSGGKIRGEEKITVAMYESDKLQNVYVSPRYLRSQLAQQDPASVPRINVAMLETRINYKNKWFCPE